MSLTIYLLLFNPRLTDMTSRLTHSITPLIQHTLSIMSSHQTAGESSRQRGSFSAQKVDDPRRVKILVCGWRKQAFAQRDKGGKLTSRAGKTSCIKTVFEDNPVKDTPYFGTTQKIEKIDYEQASRPLSRRKLTSRSILPLQFWDTPHNFDLDQLDVPLSTFSSVIYVMDMQVSCHLALGQLSSYHSKTTHTTKPQNDV